MRYLPFLALLLLSAPAHAQVTHGEGIDPDQIDSSAEAQRHMGRGDDDDDDVFDDTYAIVGVGVLSLPDYDGANETKLSPGAGIVGKIEGIGFRLRGPSLTMDFIDDPSGSDVTFRFGPALRYRGNRSGKVKDDVVARLGKLKSVVDAGVSMGVGFKRVLTPADSLSFGVSARQDVSGRGSGYTISPGISYMSPLSRGAVVGLQVSADWVSGKYARYNYSSSPEQSAASGLPAYRAKGGFKEATVGAAAAFDLNGNFLDGGFAVGAGAQYTRLYGSAAETPITAIRGSRDQWIFGGGLAYSF